MHKYNFVTVGMKLDFKNKSASYISSTAAVATIIIRFHNTYFEVVVACLLHQAQECVVVVVIGNVVLSKVLNYC